MSMVLSGSMSRRHHHRAHQPLWGMAFTVMSQLAHSLQVVVEEYVVKVQRADPLLVTGAPAPFGVFMAIGLNLILFGVTVTKHGVTRPAEDPFDVVVMLSHNWVLGAMFVVYASMLVVHDYCGTVVAQKLDSTHRVMLDGVRVVLIWGLELFMYYALHSSQIGEPWKPGLWNGSWLMLPVAVTMAFGALQFHYARWCPLSSELESSSALPALNLDSDLAAIAPYTVASPDRSRDQQDFKAWLNFSSPECRVEPKTPSKPSYSSI
eukprot:TRINITY_DN4684_c0_g1_i3.p1 TRINITY_DN4684_c0_g1~~TRINITY_DN4684_c0_g1_i3.p1  ORF type:complete len:264 (+),score=33.20 TRINITY_DN4684_c0_g1_i3:277-1068(+)